MCAVSGTTRVQNIQGAAVSASVPVNSTRCVSGSTTSTRVSLMSRTTVTQQGLFPSERAGYATCQDVDPSGVLPDHGDDALGVLAGRGVVLEVH